MQFASYLHFLSRLWFIHADLSTILQEGNGKYSNSDVHLKEHFMRKSVSDDEEIAEEICQRNKSRIIEQIGNMSDNTGNMSRLKMWKIKSKVCPKNSSSVPVAKLDESGNLVCNSLQLHSSCISGYTRTG